MAGGTQSQAIHGRISEGRELRSAGEGVYGLGLVLVLGGLVQGDIRMKGGWSKRWWEDGWISPRGS
jgi:hypothetical protein